MVATVQTLVVLGRLRREMRRSARGLKNLPKHHHKRRSLAEELWANRIKYEMARYQITGNRRGRISGY